MSKREIPVFAMFLPAKEQVSRGKKVLVEHYGDTIFINEHKLSEDKKHCVSRDKLRDCEISATIYSFGSYIIRDANVLYKDGGGYRYEQRIPADRDEVDLYLKEQNVRIDFENYCPRNCRAVREIRAVNKYDKDPKWKFICLTTCAKSYMWREQISIMCTAKKNAFAPDRKSDFFILVDYLGSSYSAETWYRFTHKGEVQRLNPNDKKWKW